MGIARSDLTPVLPLLFPPLTSSGGSSATQEKLTVAPLRSWSIHQRRCSSGMPASGGVPSTAVLLSSGLSSHVAFGEFQKGAIINAEEPTKTLQPLIDSAIYLVGRADPSNRPKVPRPTSRTAGVRPARL